MSGDVCRQILLFVLLVVIALAGGALLAYPAQFLLPEVRFSSLAERGSLICGLLISLFYAAWVLRGSGKTMGLQRPAGGWLKTLAEGYGLGLFIMLVVVVTLYALDLSRIDQRETFNTEFFITAILKGLAAGIGASLIEEILFRGALFSGLQHRINLIAAMILSSGLYAAVHYLAYPEPEGTIHWYTGLVLFPQAISNLADPGIIDHFLTLFLLGIFLCLLRWRDGHIWRAFAVHAGIIMIIKLDGYITSPRHRAEHEWLVNDDASRLGWLSTLWLVLLIAIYGWHCYRNRNT